MSVIQKDGSVEDGEAVFDSSSPPKPSHYQPYLFLSRLLRSFSTFIYLPGALLQKNRHVAERTKSKGIHIKISFVHYIICFVLGMSISFMPFFSLDISKDLVTKQKAFSFVDDVMVESTHRKIDSVTIETQVTEKVRSIENDGLDIMRKTQDFNIMELIPRKLLIIVTPTYERPFQAYYLNRLAQTLRVVPPPLLWIVVEMSSQSTETAKILRNIGVVYRHLVCKDNTTSMRNREVYQRNVALSHIEKHKLDGIVHFANDDRVYSVEIFDHMRQISHFGTWPVAALSKGKKNIFFEGPVCNGSEIIGWHTYQRNKLYRRFHVDMSGFSFNSTVLWDSVRWHRPTLEPIRQLDKSRDGLQETTFIEQMVADESQMEGLPIGCCKVMAWHLRLEAPELYYPQAWSTEKNLEVVVPLT